MDVTGTTCTATQVLSRASAFALKQAIRREATGPFFDPDILVLVLCCKVYEKDN